MSPISRDCITGLVLSGGRGSRMGGRDKGLQTHRGVPLALQALRRLQPQVSVCQISANRHLAAYAEWGAAVFPDAWPDYPGPMAGFLAGLERCTTPWLVSVPCDSPAFPFDLVERLAQACGEASADVAMPETPLLDGRGGQHAQPQPMYCLVHTRLASDLRRQFLAGERSLLRWATGAGCAFARFASADDFMNLNTLDDLETGA